MYCGTFAPWDHYPKNLRFSEVQYPLSVLIDFFSWDWPLEIRKNLKHWRHFVINHELYKHQHYEPGDLLHFHEMHVKLLEALYLLLLEHQASRYSLSEKKMLLEDQLEVERKERLYFPENLSKEELLDPYSVLQEAFSKINPQAFRDYLQDWVHAALVTPAVDTAMEPGEIITVYELLKRLYSAAWLIHQRETDQPYLNKAPDVISSNNNLPQIATMAATNPLHTIAPDLTKAQELGLEEVRKLIVSKEPTVRLIYLLGTHDSPFTYYLVILVDNSDRSTEYELSNRIEDLCRFLVSVCAIVHKVSGARSGILKGKRFWNFALHQGIEVYRASELELPKISPVTDSVWQERARRNWDRWGKQAQAFLKTAGHCICDENYGLAIFLLHQAAESGLIAITKILSGYRFTVHNISRMLRFTLLFTEDIRNVFELDTEAGLQSFSLLQNGYTDARYRNGFKPDRVSVEIAQQQIEVLLSVLEHVYLRFLSEPDSEGAHG
ncbi:hypothetical protein GCM10023149_20640 [Mucilaginibacter gynuensis]|uniref:HEPN domain-containing protein n=1 Tax=Mucilaginibacter gynuensis TaxID=1302236 RepID=A0ABP8GBX4_9SPHI